MSCEGDFKRIEVKRSTLCVKQDCGQLGTFESALMKRPGIVLLELSLWFTKKKRN